MKIKYCMLILLAVLGTIFTSLQARAAEYVDTLIAGPFVFERIQGKPYVEQEIFENLLPGGEFVLIVDSALPSADDADTVSARVTLNGVERLAPGDFNLQTQRFEVPIETADAYTLEVEMRGTPGDLLHATLVNRVPCPGGVCPPVDLHPILEPHNSASQTITPDGGSIVTMNDAGVQIVFNVPQNALRQATEITVTPVSVIQNLPLTAGLAAAVQFEPFGLLFFKPAELRFDFGESSAQNLHGFGWHDGQKDFHLQPTVELPGQVALPIYHFSGAGVGSGNAAAAGQVGANAPGLFDRYLNEDALVTNQLYSTMCANDSCPPGSEAQANFQAAYLAARDQLIEDYLHEFVTLAASSGLSSEKAMEAGTQYINFRALEQATCSPNDPDCIFNRVDIQNLLAAARDDIVAGFATHIEALGDPVCNDVALFDLLADIDSLDFTEAVVAATGDADLTALQRRVGCALSITINDFPIEITEDADGGEFTVTLAAKDVENLNGLNVGLEASQCGQVTHVSPVTGQVEVTNGASVNAEGQTPTLTLIANDCDSVQTVSVTAVVGDLVNTFFGDQVTATAVLIDSDPVLLPIEKRVEIGHTLQLQLVTPGESPALEWSATGGTISDNGLYTAGLVPGTYGVSVRIPDRNFVIHSSIEVFGTAISISPDMITVEPGGTVAFSATVVGPQDTSVTWSASGGTITAAGEYTAGNNPGEYFVTAISVADPSVSAIAQVIIPGGPSPIYGGWVGDFTLTSHSTGNVFTCEGQTGLERCASVTISSCEIQSSCIYGNLLACHLPRCSSYHIWNGEVSGDTWTGTYQGSMSSSRVFRPALPQQSDCQAQFTYSGPATGGGTVSGTVEGSLTQPCFPYTTEYFLDVHD